MNSAQALADVRSLLQLSARGASVAEIQSAGVDMIADITDSEGACFHTFDENENAIDLCMWSSSVLRHCANTPSRHYPLEHAGIWADCVRQRAPVIHNDYPAIALSLKRGLPEHHFPLRRHMSVPVFSQNRLVSVAGVGNKAQP